MKRIIAVLSNQYIAVEPGEHVHLVPSVEVVLVLGETDYSLGPESLDLVRKPATETIRFEANAETLQRTADALLAMAKWCREFTIPGVKEVE